MTWNVFYLKILAYIFHRMHCGKTVEGEDFNGFLGEEGYKEHIMDTFDDFLNNTFHKSSTKRRWN